MEALFLNHQVERVQHSLDQRIFRKQLKNSNFSSYFWAQPINKIEMQILYDSHSYATYFKTYAFNLFHF